MTVAELIKLLQTRPPDMLVAYRLYSEQCLMEPGDISTLTACPPRADGWIQDARPDVPTQKYLLFPGN